jgi:calcium permeable stress-gated cation channel
MPRTYFKTVPEHDRTPSSSHSSVPWYHDFRMLKDSFLLRHSSIDAYLFVRFLRVLMIICVLGTLLTWPILFSVNATGGGNASQLDKIAFGNVDDNKRLYAHATVAWVYFGLVIIIITRERLFAISLRQAHATLTQNAKRLSSKVVLFLSVPADTLKSDQLHQIFGPDMVRSWQVPDVGELENMVNERSSKIEKLEESELQLEKNVAKSKAQTNGTSRSRPTQKPYYLFGDDVDILDDLRKQLPDLESRVQTAREKLSSKASVGTGAIFVEYKDQACAQHAVQTVSRKTHLELNPRFSGVQPKEVLWSNLNMDPSLRISYHYLAIVFITATIILWSIPVGIVGTISNISYLTDRIHWLRFIDNLPDPILGFLTGFIPPYVLSELVSYVPNFFRYIAKLSGQPTTVEAEKLTQNWYFTFQVVQVFLITTFSSGAATVATKIANEPTSVPVLLAKNLPKAANFYLSYFIIQGLGSATKIVVNYSDLFSYIIYDRLFDQTPRQKYQRRSQMKGIAWGKAYPKFTNFAVIAIAYSCIAPLVLGFAAVGLYIFYIAYRYQFLYVIQVKLEPKGACYSQALQHLMTGIYLAELCLLGLFSIREAAGPAAMLGVLFVLTIIYHVMTNRYLSPLEKVLPVDNLGSEDEQEPLLSSEHAEQSHSRHVRRIQKMGRAAIDKLPSGLLDPFKTLLEPRLLPAVEDLRPWLVNPASGDEPPAYSDDEVSNAYKNPAFTSKMPKVWIPKDQYGVSAKEIEANDKVGISTTDEGAELDRSRKLSWSEDDFEAAPIFKAAKKY